MSGDLSHTTTPLPPEEQKKIEEFVANTPELEVMYSPLPDNLRQMIDVWAGVAKKIGCTLHGFNDESQATFITPDGGLIEVGPKFRAAIELLPDRDS